MKAGLRIAVVTLTLHVDGPKLRFDYTVDGRTQRLAGAVDARYLSTQKAGDLSGP